MESSDQNHQKPRKYRKDGKTYYYRMGKLCCMESTREGSNTPATETQIKNQDALSVTVHFASNFFNICGILSLAWESYGLPLQKSRSDIFKKINYPVLEASLQGVDYYPDFMFSKGDLVPPRDVRARRKGWMLFLDWDIPRRNFRLSRPDDALMIGYFYASRPDAPQVMVQTPFKRQDCHAEITIPDKKFLPEEGLHVYLLFRSTDWKMFSDSRYAGLLVNA